MRPCQCIHSGDEMSPASREKKNARAREWQRKKMSDPEYRVEHNARRAEAFRKKFTSNPEFAKQNLSYQREYMARRRREDLEFRKYAIVRGARHRSIKNENETLITKTDIDWPEDCPVLPWIKLDYSARSERKFDSPTLDRIDNTRGYVIGNVRVISWRANQLKRDATLEELKCLVAYVSAHTAE